MNDTTRPTASEPKVKSFYTRPKFIMGVIAAVIFLILIFQNWAPVPLNLFFVTDLKVPGAVVYIAFSLVGFGVGWVVSRSQIARAKKKK